MEIEESNGDQCLVECKNTSDRSLVSTKEPIVEDVTHRMSNLVYDDLNSKQSAVKSSDSNCNNQNETISFANAPGEDKLRLEDMEMAVSVNSMAEIPAEVLVDKSVVPPDNNEVNFAVKTQAKVSMDVGVAHLDNNEVNSAVKTQDEVSMDEGVVHPDNNEVNSTTETQAKLAVDETVTAYNETVVYPNYSFDNFIKITKSTKPFPGKKFLYGCKWSPDGTCLLTNCADYTLRLYDLPQTLYNKQILNKNEIFPELEPSLKVSEGGQIYDYDWYPFMSSWYPDTCCFLTTSSKAPIHAWDAYKGHIRATYRGYNQFDETTNAYSVKFSLNGEKIFGGYINEIKVFDTSRPGRDYVNIDTRHVAGQSGIISCLAENPTVPNMFAAGSYKKTIGLYLESGDSVCLLNGQHCGVTHLIWSNDGIYLFSGGRKDNEILCWDVRNPGDVLCTMERTVNTNQRIYFDLSSDGRYLISGNTNGELIVWDLNQTITESGKRDAAFKFQPNIDCTNGISIHRQLPLLATSSGQYHFPDLTSDDEDDSSMFKTDKMLLRIENSIKLWWVGPVEEQQMD